MVKGKRGQYFDEDDFFDEDDDYGDYDDEPLPVKPAPGSAKAGQSTKPGLGAKQAAATSGASRLAQCLVEPPPRLPDGRLQKGAKPDPALKAVAQPKYPVAPPPGFGANAASSSKSTTTFKFDTPSPDDQVRAAQSGQAVGPAPAKLPVSGPTIHLAPSKNLNKPSAVLQQHTHDKPPAAFPSPSTPTPASAPSGSTTDLVSSMGGFNIVSSSSSSGFAPPSASHQQQQQQQQCNGGVTLSQRRPVSEYSLETDLARECEAASAAEASGSAALPALHLVVLGHVDAGKSTLMGRLLHDLGYVSAKEAHKNQKESAQAGKGSFAWAWVLDERPEERQRGLTVDVAMTRFNTRRFAVTLLDAPGHRDFVPNMIAGAAQADAALLLVDGSSGGFESGFEASVSNVGGGQTREHAQLARSLGVEQLVVVVSKLDTVGYSQDRFDYIRGVLEPFLHTCGFKDACMQWLPAVGPLGENLVTPPKDPALAAWWKGPTLAAAIDGFSPRERAVTRPLRIPISDVFRSKSGSVVVGGKIEGGALRPGSRVLVVPLGEIGTVRSIEAAGAPASLARAGDSVEVSLQGIDTTNICTGSVLCHPEFPIPMVTRFELRVLVLDVPTPILSGMPVTMHAHCAREAGHVSGLVALLNAKTGEVARARPRCLLRGQTALVEVTAVRSLALEEYADYRALGRVALREGGRTLMVGVVTKLLD